jgi:hypothetical protein
MIGGTPTEEGSVARPERKKAPYQSDIRPKRARGHFIYRDDAEVIDGLEAQAHLRHRTIVNELRLAARLWLLESAAAQLRCPIGRLEAKREGHDVEADERLIRQRIARLKKEAFAVPKRTLADQVPA